MMRSASGRRSASVAVTTAAADASPTVVDPVAGNQLLSKVEQSGECRHRCGDHDCVDEDAPLHSDGRNTLLDEAPTRLS